MMYADPTNREWEWAAIVRALGSLTDGDVAAIRAAVLAEGGRYWLEQHVDYDGYVSVLVSAKADADRAFLVSGRRDAVELSAVKGEAIFPLGAFDSVDATILALRPALDELDWRLL